VKWLVLFVMVLAIGCDGCHHQDPLPVTPAALDAAAVEGGGSASCLDYCRVGDALGCGWALPTPAGATCVTVCNNNQTVGIAPWDLDCRVKQTTCAAIERCP
jgi:hypothetical protein